MMHHERNKMRNHFLKFSEDFHSFPTMHAVLTPRTRKKGHLFDPLNSAGYAITMYNRAEAIFYSDLVNHGFFEYAPYAIRDCKPKLQFRLCNNAC